jgi:DNA recombination protein RmuC
MTQPLPAAISAVAGLEVILGIAAGFAVAVFLALIVLLVRAERGRGEASLLLARVSELSEAQAAVQAELVGRLTHSQHGVGERLEALAARVGDGLIRQTERTGEQLRVLHERLAVIDAAYKTIGELTTQVGGLQELLANKQARGVFGELQLRDLVAAVLPPANFTLQATLGNGMRADCLLRLPDPPGPIIVDAKFPLESFRALRAARDEAARVRACRSFSQDVLKHVRDIAEKYIVPGETADSAMLFLPSEAVYAELHANFPNVVEESYRRKVWIVSPTTLWATLNTLRAVLRDVRLRQEAHVIHAQLAALIDDLGRLDQRAANLQKHFAQASEDLRQLCLTAEKVAARAGRIDLSQPDWDAAGEGAPRGADGSTTGA